jgi:hypothetical protein
MRLAGWRGSRGHPSRDVGAEAVRLDEPLRGVVSTLAQIHGAVGGAGSVGEPQQWARQVLLFSKFRRGDPLPVTTHALARLLVQIAPRGSWSIAQGLFNAGHVFAEPNQNQFALSAARHFGAKQPKDEGIGRLVNSPDRCVGSLSFQATQASAIDKRLWILAYGSTTKLGNSVAGQAQND